MKKIASKLLVVLLSLVVFVTTSGFSIFNHHCNYRKTTTTSVFLEVDCCNHYSFGVKLKSPDAHDLSIDREACCKTNRVFHKIENPFEKNVQQKIEIPFETFNFSSLLENKVDEEFFDKIDLSYVANGPPLINRKLLFYINQLKLAPPSC
jgi:hypothetical protein